VIGCALFDMSTRKEVQYFHTTSSQDILHYPPSDKPDI